MLKAEKSNESILTKYGVENTDNNNDNKYSRKVQIPEKSMYSNNVFVLHYLPLLVRIIGQVGYRTQVFCSKQCGTEKKEYEIIYNS